MCIATTRIRRFVHLALPRLQDQPLCSASTVISHLSFLSTIDSPFLKQGMKEE